MSFAISRRYRYFDRSFRRCLCQEVQHEAHTKTEKKQVYRLSAKTQVDQQHLDYIKSLSTATMYKKYPGAALRHSVKPPKQLVQAALLLAKKYPVKNLAEEAKKLQQYLWSRQVPPENSVVQQKARQIEHKLLSAKLQKQEDNELSPEDIEKVQQAALLKTKKSTYHWRPVDLDAYLSVVYMRCQLTANYSVFYSIMHEIAACDPNYKPLSMLDFGSGLATSIWAAREVWGSVEEHYCWDKSADVSTLARLLLQEGKDHADMLIPGVYFRQQFERKDANQSAGFDLVVSGHSLFELPNRHARLNIVDRLWTQANSYLILAENGTAHGHRLIEEARMHILTKYRDGVHQGHVVAPCPHDKPCKMVNEHMSRPCNFEVKYKIAGGAELGGLYHKEVPEKKKKATRSKQDVSTRYCYVVLKKGDPPQERFPRMLTPPYRNKSSCIQCHMCLPDGSIKHINVQKRIVPRRVFKLVQTSIWGTRLPFTGLETIELAGKRDDDTEALEERDGDTDKHKDS